MLSSSITAEPLVIRGFNFDSNLEFREYLIIIVLWKVAQALQSYKVESVLAKIYTVHFFA